MVFGRPCFCQVRTVFGRSRPGKSCRTRSSQSDDRHAGAIAFTGGGRFDAGLMQQPIRKASIWFVRTSEGFANGSFAPKSATKYSPFGAPRRTRGAPGENRESARCDPQQANPHHSSQQGGTVPARSREPGVPCADAEPTVGVRLHRCQHPGPASSTSPSSSTFMPAASTGSTMAGCRSPSATPPAEAEERCYAMLDEQAMAAWLNELAFRETRRGSVSLRDRETISALSDTQTGNLSAVAA